MSLNKFGMEGDTATYINTRMDKLESMFGRIIESVEKISKDIEEIKG